MDKIIRSKTYADADFKVMNSKANSFLKKIAKEDLINVSYQATNGIYSINIIYLAEVKAKEETRTAE